MTDIEKITLKIREIQADIKSLRREMKNKEKKKVEKVTVNVDAIVEQAVNECKKLILVDNINSAIDKKVNINFVNNLYRNK